jgi:hypothetical protein
MQSTLVAWQTRFVNSNFMGSLKLSYPRLKKALTLLWIALVVAGVAVYLHKNGDVFLSYAGQTEAALVLLSVILTVMGKLMTAYQMKTALQIAGYPAGNMEGLRLYSYADITKYAPGGIWGIVSRLGMYKARRMPVKAISQAFTMEHIWLIGSSLVIGGILYATALAIDTQHEFGIPTFLGVVPKELLSAMALVATVFSATAWVFVLKYSSRILSCDVSYGRTILLFILQTFLWGSLGAGFAVLMPVAGYSAPVFLLLAGAFSIAFGLGFLAFWAPAGIGVREAALFLLISPVLGFNTIMAVCLLSRCLWFLADILFFATVYGGSIIENKNRQV